MWFFAGSSDPHRSTSEPWCKVVLVQNIRLLLWGDMIYEMIFIMMKNSMFITSNSKYIFVSICIVSCLHAWIVNGPNSKPTKERSPVKGTCKMIEWKGEQWMQYVANRQLRTLLFVVLRIRGMLFKFFNAMDKYVLAWHVPCRSYLKQRGSASSDSYC